MHHPRRIFVPLAVAVFLASCAGSADPAPSNDGPLPESDAGAERGRGFDIEQMRADSLAKIDQEACAEKGGVVEQAGMLGLFRCTIPYADGGKICRDDADCEGRCLTSTDVTDFEAAPGDGQGQCEPSDNPFGCYGEIIEGEIGATLCVD